MSGKARIVECPVRQKVAHNDADPAGRKLVVDLDPAIEGDDYTPHNLGIALQTFGTVDVFAMDPERPGYVLEDSDGYWVALINGTVLDGPKTIEEVLGRFGYELAM